MKTQIYISKGPNKFQVGKAPIDHNLSKAKENLESSKRKPTCDVQWILNKIIRISGRNGAGQKAVGGYI